MVSISDIGSGVSQIQQGEAAKNAVSNDLKTTHDMRINIKEFGENADQASDAAFSLINNGATLQDPKLQAMMALMQLNMGFANQQSAAVSGRMYGGGMSSQTTNYPGSMFPMMPGMSGMSGFPQMPNGTTQPGNTQGTEQQGNTQGTGQVSVRDGVYMLGGGGVGNANNQGSGNTQGIPSASNFSSIGSQAYQSQFFPT